MKSIETRLVAVEKAANLDCSDCGTAITCRLSSSPGLRLPAPCPRCGRGVTVFVVTDPYAHDVVLNNKGG